MMVDVDGLPAQVHGQQPGSQYNGYYGPRHTTPADHLRRADSRVLSRTLPVPRGIACERR